MNDILYAVVPCYNEQEVLRETAKRLREKFQSLIVAEKISPQSRIVFVNDGSKDSTWNIIRELHGHDKIFSGINLSRNRGHQNALLAGLMTVKNFADAVISMDADLQDDINAIDEMIDKFHGGFDIVYGVRSKRETDTFFKRFTAESFYKLIKFLGGDIVNNHADYRLMSRRALDGLAEFGEVNLFLRGLVPMIGYPSTTVYYERAERFAGESKYPLKKMLFFAFQGITSDSHDNDFGRGDVDDKFPRDSLDALRIFFRLHGSRLVEYVGVAVVHRRTDSAFNRHCRRIRRENLS